VREYARENQNELEYDNMMMQPK